MKKNNEISCKEAKDNLLVSNTAPPPPPPISLSSDYSVVCQVRSKHTVYREFFSASKFIKFSTRLCLDHSMFVVIQTKCIIGDQKRPEKKDFIKCKQDVSPSQASSAKQNAWNSGARQDLGVLIIQVLTMNSQKYTVF